MKEIAKLQYITPGGTNSEIMDGCKAFLDGGGRWIQLRMKGASCEEFTAAAMELKPLCREYGAVMLINDSVEVALASGADGVHLGKGDIDTLMARTLLGGRAIIGRTANTLEDVVELSKERIDYIGLGPFRFTTTKEKLSPTLGLAGYNDIITRAAQMGITMPVVAVGGITEGDIDSIMSQGLYGIAISGAIAHNIDPRRATESILERINKL